MSNGIVYFIKPQHESCYKIGMSKSSTIKRLKDYGSKSIIIQVHACSDPAFIEELLIDAFNKEFQLVKGREYFGGDPQKMLTVFNDIVNKYADWSHASTDDFDTVVIEPKDTHIEDIVKEISEAGDTYAIHECLYELISILPDKYFNELELLMNVIYVIRNFKGIDDRTRIATLHKLILNRSTVFVASDLPGIFMTKMKSINRRYTYLSLAKFMRTLNDDIRQSVDQWQSKWNNKKSNNHSNPSLIYSYNAITYLPAIKNAFPTLTTKKILAIDSRFAMSRIDICKSCHKKHLKGCCKHYSRTNSTKATIIKNAMLV